MRVLDTLTSIGRNRHHAKHSRSAEVLQKFLAQFDNVHFRLLQVRIQTCQRLYITGLVHHR
jgi:hypothetical protein